MNYPGGATVNSKPQTQSIFCNPTPIGNSASMSVQETSLDDHSDDDSYKDADDEIEVIRSPLRNNDKYDKYTATKTTLTFKPATAKQPEKTAAIKQHSGENNVVLIKNEKKVDDRILGIDEEEEERKEQERREQVLREQEEQERRSSEKREKLNELKKDLKSHLKEGLKESLKESDTLRKAELNNGNDTNNHNLDELEQYDCEIKNIEIRTPPKSIRIDVKESPRDIREESDLRRMAKERELLDDVELIDEEKEI